MQETSLDFPLEHACDDPVIASRLDARVVHALRAVDKNTHVSVLTLARQVGLSGSRLEHLIKEQTGRSLREHKHRIRLRKSAELLTTTHWRVSEIAYALGFGHAGSLTHQFRNHFGIPPSVYRRQPHREKANAIGDSTVASQRADQASES
jgi:AraC family transcriptional regulator, arabinose operon regulatory protein